MKSLSEVVFEELEKVSAERDELKAQVAAMREVLKELVSAPPVFTDDRLDYVEIQVSKTALEDAEKALSPSAGRELLDELERLRDENNVLWAIFKTCPGCGRFVPGVIYGCDIQRHIDLSGYCNQKEE
jgi:chromosome segregation ATPase